jgi:YggT family protein
MFEFIKHHIYWIFPTYTLMIMARVIGSWFPSFSGSKAMRFVGFYTDPYLNLFRRFIPPIGGRLDLSPMLAFSSLQIVEMVVKAFLK